MSGTQLSSLPIVSPISSIISSILQMKLWAGVGDGARGGVVGGDSLIQGEGWMFNERLVRFSQGVRYQSESHTTQQSA